MDKAVAQKQPAAAQKQPADRKERRSSRLINLRDIRFKTDGTKRRSRADAAAQPELGQDEEAASATPRHHGQAGAKPRESLHRMSGTGDNDTHGSSSESGTDGENEKLDELVWQLDRMELKLEEHEQALAATEATIERLHSSDVTDKGIRFNRNQEQTELAKAEKRAASKRKAIKAITQDIDKLMRRIEAVRKEDGDDGDDRSAALQKMLSAMPKAFQTGGQKVLNRLRNKHHAVDGEEALVDDDIQVATLDLPPDVPRGRTAATSSVTLDRSPSPLPREESDLPDTLRRKRSQTLSELEVDDLATPLSRNRTTARSIGSVNRDATPRTFTSRARKLLTPLRFGREKQHGDESEHSAVEEGACGALDEVEECDGSDAVSTHSLRVSPNIAGGLPDELFHLLVPNPDFVPDAKDVDRLELKVLELQQELHAGDVTIEQMQAQLDALNQQAQRQETLMERIEHRIAQEARQLEQGVQSLESKLAGKLDSNDKQLDQAQHELARLRAECETLVCKSRHASAKVSDFVDDLQLKEQALSLASAESVFARVGRLLGSSVDSVSNQSLLLPGMVMLVIAVYISKWWFG